VISRIVLANIRGSTSTECSFVPYLPGSSTHSSPTNPTSVSVVMLCSICRQPMDEEQGNLYTVKGCKHTYHKHCISQWKKHSMKCPCCQGPVPNEIGLTLSRLQNVPVEEDLSDMTLETILENVIFSPIGIIWPICLVSLFVLFETAFVGIFITLTFFMALYIIFKEESHRTINGICLVIVLCLIFPPVVVILVTTFILQMFYIFYKTVVFYVNVFTCKMRWSSANKFIINRTVSLITYIFEVLEEM